MHANPTQIASAEFAPDGEKVAPVAGKIADGYLPLEQVPAENLNYYLSMLTRDVINYGEAFRSSMAELTTILSAANLTPDPELVNQIKAALDVLYKTPLDTHVGLYNPHGAVSAATASRIMLRDANSRSQVASPSADADVANKGYVDGKFWNHIVDSNATFDAWCQCTNGTMKRVYIKAGTWTASALSPTAQVLVNLEVAGTVEVYGEIGSELVYSGSYNGIIYGLYHSSVVAEGVASIFTNVVVKLTNTHAAGSTTAFYCLRRMSHCRSIETGVSSGTHMGFVACRELFDCYSEHYTAVSDLGGVTGFSLCQKMLLCSTVIMASMSSGDKPVFGMYSCYELENCAVTISLTGSRTGSVIAMGHCTHIVGGILSSMSAFTDGIVAFINAGLMVENVRTGNSANSGAGSSYNILNSNKVHGCSTGTAKTSKYYISYADAETSYACADTAPGGYNS